MFKLLYPNLHHQKIKVKKMFERYMNEPVAKNDHYCKDKEKESELLGDCIHGECSYRHSLGAYKMIPSYICFIIMLM